MSHVCVPPCLKRQTRRAHPPKWGLAAVSPYYVGDSSGCPLQALPSLLPPLPLSPGSSVSRGFRGNSRSQEERTGSRCHSPCNFHTISTFEHTRSRSGSPPRWRPNRTNPLPSMMLNRRSFHSPLRCQLSHQNRRAPILRLALSNPPGAQHHCLPFSTKSESSC